MTRIYVMESCPDCTQVKQMYKDNKEYDLTDLSACRSRIAAEGSEQI